MIDALTTMDSASFAFDLARGCLAVACRDRARRTGILGRRSVAGGTPSTTDGRDIVTAAKAEFRRANLWLDKVLGPLGYDNVSFLSQKQVCRGSTDP